MLTLSLLEQKRFNIIQIPSIKKTKDANYPVIYSTISYNFLKGDKK